MFYKEDTYAAATFALSGNSDGNSIFFWEYITKLKEELDNAINLYQGTTQTLSYIDPEENDLDNTKTTRLGEHSIEHDWLPLYQRLIEGLWTPLARIYLYCIEAKDPSAAERYTKTNLATLEAKLKNKFKLPCLFRGWDKLLRNNIAHNLYRFSSKVHEKEQIITQNSDKSEDFYTFNLIRIRTRNLYDCCSAMLYAILKKLNSLSTEHEISSLGVSIREIMFCTVINKTGFITSENTFIHFEHGKTQRNITIEYNGPIDKNLQGYAILIADLCHILLPATQYLINFRRGKITLLLNRIDDDQVENLISGNLLYNKDGSIKGYQLLLSMCLNKINNNPTIFRSILYSSVQKNIAGYLKNKWIHYRNQKRGYIVFREEKLTMGRNLRNHVFIYIDEGLNLERLKLVIKKETRKRISPFKSLIFAFWDLMTYPVSPKRRARAYHSIVFLSFWNKVKRADDMHIAVNYGHELCFACSEWNKDDHFKWLSDQKKSDILLDDIRVRLFCELGNENKFEIEPIQNTAQQSDY